MTHHEAQEPVCRAENNVVKVVITPKSKSLGDFSVRRVLPSSMSPRVGPFVFFDHMGPASFEPGQGINVRPHPHIGLSTVTYLFAGEILHADSLGYVQPIQPGAVNLMTAGKGIVHSERTSEELLASGQTLHGLQVWMALPDEHQEIDPDFKHYPASELPSIKGDDFDTTVVIGTYQGQTSGVSVLPQTLYVDHVVHSDVEIFIPADVEERAVYVVEGEASIAGCELESGSMAVLEPGEVAVADVKAGSRIVLIGGEAMSDRHLFWNFVHSSKDQIEDAKQRWREGQFDMVPCDDEFIPLPEVKS